MKGPVFGIPKPVFLFSGKGFVLDRIEIAESTVEGGPMKRKHVAFLLVFVGMTLTLTGCSLKTVRKEDSRIEHSRTFEREYDTVWSATIKTILANGYTMLSQDKNSGSISTDYLIMREAIALRAGYRYKVNVFVEKESNSKTKVTITPEFQVKNTDKAPWTLWSRHVNQINFEKDLFDEIQRGLPVTVSATSSPSSEPAKPPETSQSAIATQPSQTPVPSTPAPVPPSAAFQPPRVTQTPPLRTTQVTATPDENLREKPQGKIIRKVKKGTTLIILEETDKWLRIRLDDGTEAWIWKASTSEASKTNPSKLSK